MSTPLPRRAVLCGLAALAVPTAACEGEKPPRTPGTGTAKPGTELARLSALPAVGGALVDTGGNGILLMVRTADGAVRAFDPRCPHKGNKVSQPVNGVIDCPAHGSAFDGQTGELRKGPAKTGLTQVAVRVEGERIVLV
ncbi:nitrite reductase/ring-hydroxylating ferredoxin subunit [Crossiella equi]|uniref:Nitrite reductase/ring-hydroxylating ferredoxin subunit n=1 Tax=Crossiella equi TaxID=130796 RepID=A0ABS5APG3_9PSEU|nr:Rieske (2Fe-2S) protein [Crossiella equi]MBP2478287.1 nitrite reductase/ring-hydroxylating ferredoxin subunit [Crossiella equi]